MDGCYGILAIDTIRLFCPSFRKKCGTPQLTQSAVLRPDRLNDAQSRTAGLYLRRVHTAEIHSRRQLSSRGQLTSPGILGLAF